MKLIKRTLFYIGFALLLLTLVLTTVMKFYIDSYLVQAYMKAIVIPICLGAACLLLGFMFVRQRGFLMNVLVKVLTFIGFVFLLFLLSRFSVANYVADIQAVLQDDLTVFEATVVDTRIDTKELSTKDSDGNKKYRYTQWILLDNEEEFKVTLKYKDKPKFERDKQYEITLLPHSKHMLDSKEVTDG